MGSIPCSTSPITQARPWHPLSGQRQRQLRCDQLAVDLAVAQLPPELRAGHRAGDDADKVVHPMVVRTDTAGYVAAFVQALVARNIEFSISAG